MSLESSSSSLGPSFNKDVSAKPMPGHDPSPREIKGFGSIVDGGKMEKIAQPILSSSSSSSDAPAKLAGRRIKPAKELVETLTTYAHTQSAINHAEVAQLILHNNQTLFKEVAKKPEIGALLTTVGQKYHTEAVAANEDPKFIKIVDKELEKINLADSHKNLKQSKNIRLLGREIDDRLANYNELLLKAPNDIERDKLIDRMGKLISDNLAYFNSHSVESLIIGDDQAMKLIEQLKILRSTLQQVPGALKSPVTKQLEDLVLKILPDIDTDRMSNLPKVLQKMVYERLPAKWHDLWDSLQTCRALIIENPQFGYECLAAWISTSRIDIGLLQNLGFKLSAKELEGIAPFLKHVTISEWAGWDNAEYNRFIDSCTQLISLELKDTSSVLTELTAKRCKKLIHLNLSNSKVITLPEKMPCLQSLRVNAQLKKLPTEMPALKSLDISQTDLRGAELEALAPQLSHLIIGHWKTTLERTSVWNNETFNDFIQKCTHLISLKITEDDIITHLNLKLGSLQKLTCHLCLKLTNISGDLPALEEIDLHSTTIKKEDLVARASQLKAVTICNNVLAKTSAHWNNVDYNEFIQSCTKLRSLTIRTPNLTSLPPVVLKQLTNFSCRGCKNLKTIPPLDKVVFFDYSDSGLEVLPSMPVVKQVVGKK